MVLVRDNLSYHEFNDCRIIEPSLAHNLPSQISQIAAVEKGTPIKISSVHWLNAIDTQTVIAVTQVFVPNEGKWVDCEYLWNPGQHEYIRRAPWERESVPEKRFIGMGGKKYEASSQN